MLDGHGWEDYSVATAEIAAKACFLVCTFYFLHRDIFLSILKFSIDNMISFMVSAVDSFQRPCAFTSMISFTILLSLYALLNNFSNNFPVLSGSLSVRKWTR